MSREVDERVVEMRFDNAQFEKNVQTSMSTLDKLKQSLKLENSAKGFENLGKATKNFSLNDIAAGVDALQKRFSAFGIIGMRVLENLTDKAMAFASKTMGAMTNSIIQGGKTRAFNIENAHFQLQGLLKDETKVQAVMKDAMDSVDGTAYAYDEAAKAAAQFAASGLEAGTELQAALRGITGVAAMTNSEYSGISEIFTTVAGNGRLMAMQLLQLSSRGLNAAATIRDYFNGIGDGSIDASESVTAAVKKLTGGLNVSESDIRDFVTKGNISFELFSAAMDNAFGEHAKKANETFTGALSNVKSALARIGAEFYSPLIVQNGPLVQFLNALREKINEAKNSIVPLAEIFTSSVSAMVTSATKFVRDFNITAPIDSFVASIQRMATFVKSLSTLGALKNLAEGLMFTFRGLGKIVGTVGDAFQSVFSGPSLYGVTKFAEAFKKLAASFDVKIVQHLSQFKDIFSGVFSVFHIFWQAISSVVQALGSVISSLAPAGNAFLNFAAYVGRGITALDQFISENKLFGTVFSTIANVVSTAARTIGSVMSNIGEAINHRGLPGAVAAIKTAMGKIGEALQSMVPIIAKVGALVGNAIGNFFSGVLKAIHGAGFDSLVDLFNSTLMVGIGVGITKFVNNLVGLQNVAGGFLNKWSGIGGNINNVLISVRTQFTMMQASLKADVLMKIAKAIAVLAIALVAIASIDSGKLAESLGAITVLFGDLMGSLAIFSKFSAFNFKMYGVSFMMTNLAIAIAILAGAMKSISGLDWNGVAKGLVGITGAMAAMVGSMKLMSLGGGSTIKGATQIVIFAAAIKILASVCKDLAGLAWESLAKGLIGVGSLLAAVSLFLNTAKFSGKSALTAAGIAILAGAIKILASVCKDFSQMNWEQIGKGLAAVGGLLLEIAAFTNLAGAAKHIASSGVALIAIAASMKIFASAMSDFSTMEWEEIAKGLVAMGGALAAIAIATRVMPSNMVGLGIGLIAVGAALEIMADALGKLGNMTWEEVAKGFVAMGGALAELAIGLTFMTGTLAGSAALIVAAGALAILAPVLTSLGSMSWEGIAKGLLAIGGAFAVVGVAGVLLTPLIPALLGLSAALALIGASAALFGVGFLAIGAGISAIAVGIAALAQAMSTGVTAIVSGLKAIILGIAELIPALAEQLGRAVITFCQVIAEGAPEIAKAVKSIVLSLIDVFVECIPALADGLMKLIVGVLDALVDYGPQIVDRVMQFLTGIIDSLAARIPELVQSVINLFATFFASIVDALSEIDSNFLTKAIEGIGLLSGMMLALASIASLTPGAMLGVLGIGAVITELGLVIAAIGGLAQLPGLSWLIGEGGQLLQAIGTAIGSFVGGIAGGIASGFTSQLPEIGANLSSFISNLQPFIEGASSITPDILSGIKTLTDVILTLTAADILNGLTSWLTGGASLADFGAQLVPFGEAMTNFSNSLDIDADLITAATTAGKALAEMAATIPNSGGLISFFTGENDMEYFGSQLEGFGKAMSAFSASVSELTPETVVNAANAGKALSEMANTIPNSGGLIEFFAGGNNMEMFGAQLTSFGKAMVDYSNAVVDLKADAIATSVTAATSLVALADAIPNTGGLISAFSGENAMDMFGTQLTTFGKAMVDYSDAVTGLKPEAISNSVSAANALVALAKSIPKMGGLVTFFTGSNDLTLFGSNLVQFGGSLSSYSTAIVNVKADAVSASANAASALSSLANGLPDIGIFERWFSGGGKLAAFGEGISQLGSAIGTYSAKIANVNVGKMSSVIAQVRSLASLSKELAGVNQSAFSNFSKALANLGKTSLDGFIKAFQNGGNQVRGAIQTMMSSIGTAITQNKSKTDAAMKVVVTSMVKVVTDGSKTMKTAATNCITSFSKGIKSGQSASKSAMATVVRAAASAASQYRSSFVSAGASAGAGFVAGIQSKLSAAASAGGALGRAALNAAKAALAIHSPSKEFIYLGEHVGEGMAIGIKNNIVLAKDAASELAEEVIAVSEKGLEVFESWLEEKKYYNEISLKDELSGWNALQNKYKAGSEERKKIDREIYRVQNELVSATYQYSIDWIEEEKYYKRLSLEEELAAYERMQARYREGSEERKKIDREIYRVRNEIVDASYQNSMNWIEQEKYYNRMSLSDELAAYKRVQSRYAKGTDERKKMDREVYRVEKEIYEAQQQYLTDIQELQESANQKRLELEQDYADKVASINEQLARDIESENKRYTDALESRTDALYRSYGLFDEVKEREEISSDTLMQNLEDQVKEFRDWQDILDDLSARGVDDELISELSEMGPSAISQIEVLNKMTDSELEKYVSLWSVKHAQARSQAVDELKGLRIETLNNIKQLRVDAEEKLEEYRKTLESNLAQLTADTEAEMERLKTEFEKKVGLIKENTEKQMKEMSETAQKILRDAGWDQTGQKIVQGLTQGVVDEKPVFISEMMGLALAAVDAVEEVLEIRSPSRVFWRLGNFTGLGFINGLSQYADKSYEAGEEIAESVESGLSNVMASVANLIENGIDAEPRIRPVLDLSNISEGTDELNQMLSSSRSLGLIRRTGVMFDLASGINQPAVKVDNDNVVQELRSLRGEMSDMANRIARMQIVLDSGLMVGALAGPMDEALGQIAAYKVRGN